MSGVYSFSWLSKLWEKMCVVCEHVTKDIRKKELKGVSGCADSKKRTTKKILFPKPILKLKKKKS